MPGTWCTLGGNGNRFLEFLPGWKYSIRRNQGIFRPILQTQNHTENRQKHFYSLKPFFHPLFLTITPATRHRPGVGQFPDKCRMPSAPDRFRLQEQGCFLRVRKKTAFHQHSGNLCLIQQHTMVFSVAGLFSRLFSGCSMDVTLKRIASARAGAFFPVSRIKYLCAMIFASSCKVILMNAH